MAEQNLYGVNSPQDKALLDHFFGGGDLQSLSDQELNRLKALVVRSQKPAAEQIQEAFAERVFPSGPVQPDAPAGDVADWRKAAANVTRAGEVASGFLPLPAARMLGGGIMGAATGALENEDPIEGAVSRGLGQAALSGSMDAISRFVPKLMTETGLFLGGANRLKGRIGEVGEAWDRIRDRMPWGRSLPVTDRKQTEAMLREAGSTKANSIGALPNRDIDLDSLKGSVTRRFGNAPKSLYERELNTPDPVKNRQAVVDREEDIIYQQKRARQPQGLTLGQTNLQPVKLNVREADELVQGLRSSPGTQNVINARKTGAPISDVESINAEVVENLARELQEEAAQSAAYQGVSLRSLNSNISDLKRVQEAQRSLRGGGYTFGDLGMAGVRGGLGAAMGGAGAGLTGQDRNTGFMLGGLAGVFGLSPSALSRMGSAVGYTADTVPTIARIWEWLQEEENQPVRQPAVRLREP